MIKLTKQQLARNLDRTIGAQVGLKGLKILIYGWMRFKGYAQKYRESIWHRQWLYITEVHELSEYSGYDLLKNES